MRARAAAPALLLLWSLGATGCFKADLTLGRLDGDDRVSDADAVDTEPARPRDPGDPDDRGPLDEDGDGIPDATDNCPAAANVDQADHDDDGLGDACDPDDDDDGLPDEVDNCPRDPNPEQTDTDLDGRGDVCDPDPQRDRDGDGLSDADEDRLGTDPERIDSDGDGLADGVEIAFVDAPRDTDGDGTLDALDLDSDGDELPDAEDPCPLDGTGDSRDSDGDGVGDGCDPAPERCLLPALSRSEVEVSRAVDDVGCADGTREGFVNPAVHVDIAGCAGAWARGGVGCGSFTPTCGRSAGDDAPDPTGAGCSVADLCAPGWHVCTGLAEVAHVSPDGCAGAGGQPGDFFLTRQPADACGRCAAGDAACTDVAACARGCQPDERLDQRLIGCGDTSESADDACSPLAAVMGPGCDQLAAPWSCATGAGDVGPLRRIVKSAGTGGGVLCCRDRPDHDGDGLASREDPCPLAADGSTADLDGDGVGDGCDDDDDGDGVGDDDDVCPRIADPDQTDSDGDGRGDACAGDADGDGVPDSEDRCPAVPAPAGGHTDEDGDGVGDRCDDWPDNPLMPALWAIEIGTGAVGRDAGCADGQREAFDDPERFPDIAACSGGWTLPGLLLDPLPPRCARGGGDDGERPAGQGCAAADLCAAGWHVCAGAAAVAAAGGCPETIAEPGTFFATRQAVSTCGLCASGARDCADDACDVACAARPAFAGALVGCGNVGEAPSPSCAPLDRAATGTCGALLPPWSCPGHAEPAAGVVKPAPEHGGVLCCRDRPDSDDDGIPGSLDNCPDTPNPDQADSDGDGVGDACP